MLLEHSSTVLLVQKNHTIMNFQDNNYFPYYDYFYIHYYEALPSNNLFSQTCIIMEAIV